MHRAQRLIKQKRTRKDRAEHPDAHPDSVGGADGDGSNRQRQQEHASGDGRANEKRRPRPAEPISVFQANRPGGLQDSGDDKIDPRHSVHTRRLVLTGYGAPRPELQRS